MFPLLQTNLRRNWRLPASLDIEQSSQRRKRQAPGARSGWTIGSVASVFLLEPGHQPDQHLTVQRIHAHAKGQISVDQVDEVVGVEGIVRRPQRANTC